MLGFPDYLLPELEDAETSNGAPAALHQRARWGQDMYSPTPPPLIEIQLAVEGGSLVFVPSLEEVEASVVQCFDGMMIKTENIHDVSAKVPQLFHSLTPCKLMEFLGNFTFVFHAPHATMPSQ